MCYDVHRAAAAIASRGRNNHATNVENLAYLQFVMLILWAQYCEPDRRTGARALLRCTIAFLMGKVCHRPRHSKREMPFGVVHWRAICSIEHFRGKRQNESRHVQDAHTHTLHYTLRHISRCNSIKLNLTWSLPRECATGLFIKSLSRIYDNISLASLSHLVAGAL